MLQLLRYLWDDAFAYVAAAGILIGGLVACVPPIAPKMPPSYGYWVIGVSAAVFLYRASKAAILFRLGKRTEAQIHDVHRAIGITKLSYSFKIDRTVYGKWQTSNQDSEGKLSVAYWESYPSFHIAYWN